MDAEATSIIGKVNRAVEQLNATNKALEVAAQRQKMLDQHVAELRNRKQVQELEIDKQLGKLKEAQSSGPANPPTA